jgi:hypothetical protein
MKDRNAYVEFIEERYFGSVANTDFDQILQCFTEDARVIIRHGDLPERLFSMNPAAAESDLHGFYQHLCDNYDCWFGDYHHYIDLEQNTAASRFSVRLEPKSDSVYAGAPTQELHNCNFFEFRDDRISEMIIYYSNPERETDFDDNPKRKPTGYPQP